MYSPKYTITNKILNGIARLEAAREVIENAPLVPSFEKQFQADAVIRTVYHGTHIEGNDLTLIQAKKVLEGAEVYGRPRDVQEVINYRATVALIDEVSRGSEPYSIEMLKKVHTSTVQKIVPEEKVGRVRSTQVVIREEGTGNVILTPPSFVEVPYLLEDFFAWLNGPEGREVHTLIRAAITHYVLVAIHPFVEGNGRTARAFATLVLFREGYDVKRFFALEEHFDHDLAGYYESLFKVDAKAPEISERDLTPWIEYFIEVVGLELTKIKEKVRKLSIDTRLKVKFGQQIALSERQMRLIEYLSDQGSAIMKDLKKVLPMVSEDTVLRDLQDMVKKGIIKKEGATKAVRYLVASRG